MEFGFSQLIKDLDWFPFFTKIYYFTEIGINSLKNFRVPQFLSFWFFVAGTDD